MGPPPKYLIQRKLIRSVSKKVLPQNPLLPRQYFTNLMNCWKTYGVGSSKCTDEEMQYDFAQGQTINFRQKLSKMGIKQLCFAQLQRPIYHFDLKGRHTAERRFNINKIDLTNALF